MSGRARAAGAILCAAAFFVMLGLSNLTTDMPAKLQAAWILATCLIALAGVVFAIPSPNIPLDDD